MSKKTKEIFDYYLIDEEEKLSLLTLNSDAIIIPEVFGSNYFKGKFLGLGLKNESGSYFITRDVLVSSEELKRYLENEKYSKKTFDYKTLLMVLHQENIKIRGVCFDLLLDAYLINPSYSSDDFKRVADNFTNSNILYLENIYGSNTKMAVPNISIYSDYAVRKCLIIQDIYPDVIAKIKEIDVEYLSSVELHLSEVLSKVEFSGLIVYIDHLKEIGEDLNYKVEEISKRIFDIAGEEFNINSPKQLGEILFDKMQLPHGKKNKTGFSTNVDVLEKLAEKYEIAKLILKYRGYVKLISTYVNGIMEVTDEDRYIHPLYKQALTLTGRLSSIEPNIQNMPIRTEEGQVIREIFVSRFPDGEILSADYSQIELRVLAHMAKDDRMIEAFRNTVDFHSQTASELFDVKLENVTKNMRRTAKAINFGIIYGMSAWGLSEAINISPLEANIYINKYFYTYDQAKTCLDNFITSAKATGYSLTLYNRRRYLPEILSDNANLRGFGERTAMNSPIQGTAADIIKIAMIKIYDAIKKNNLKSLIIAQVHDELVFDCPLSEVSAMKKLIKEAMENAVKLEVPLIAEVSSGKNWFEAK